MNRLIMLVMLFMPFCAYGKDEKTIINFFELSLEVDHDVELSILKSESGELKLSAYRKSDVKKDIENVDMVIIQVFRKDEPKYSELYSEFVIDKHTTFLHTKRNIKCYYKSSNDYFVLHIQDSIYALEVYGKLELLGKVLSLQSNCNIEN